MTSFFDDGPRVLTLTIILDYGENMVANNDGR